MDIEIQKSPRQIVRKIDWWKGVLWHDLLTVIMYKTSTQIRKISHNAVVLEAPKTTPRCGYSLEELTGLSIVVLMPVVYYGERIQNKISTEKRCMEWSLEEAKCRFLCLWMCFIPPASHYDDTCETLSANTGILERLNKVFFKWQSGRHFFPSIYQNSRFTEGNQVYRINHLVGTKTSAEPLLAVMEWWEPSPHPTSQIPIKGQPFRWDLTVAVFGLLYGIFSAQEL